MNKDTTNINNMNKDTVNINNKVVELTEKILDKIAYYNSKNNNRSFWNHNDEEHIKVAGQVGLEKKVFSENKELHRAYVDLIHYQAGSVESDKSLGIRFTTDASHSYFTIRLFGNNTKTVDSGYFLREIGGLYDKVSELYERTVELVEHINHKNKLYYEVENVPDAEKSILLMNYDIDNF